MLEGQKSRLSLCASPGHPGLQPLDIIGCSWTLLGAPAALRAEPAGMYVLNLPAQGSGHRKISRGEHWLSQDPTCPSVQQLFLA